MVVRVSPTEPTPTHHIKLTDGVNTVGLVLCDANGNANSKAFQRSPYPRSALKIYQGEQTYSDLEPPYTPIAQSDWSGGRGSETFDTNSTQFFDSYLAATQRPNEIVLGGQPVWCTGHLDQDFYNPRYLSAGIKVSWEWHRLHTGTGGDGRAIGMQITASASYTAARAWLILRKVGTPAALTFGIHASGSTPGSLIDSDTIAESELDDLIAQPVYLDGVSAALTSGTGYWIVVTADTADNSSNYWEVLTVVYPSGGKAGDGDPLIWATVDRKLVYRIAEATLSGTTYKGWFINYKGALYHVVGNTLYVNGYHGVASAATSTTLTDSTRSWATDELAGAICLLYDGTGSDVFENWRVITSNTATQLTVDRAWSVTPSTDTIYVILGMDKWTEITGHGISTTVTDVLVINGMVYFAQGNSVNIRRMRWYISGGAWTAAYTDDGTNKARLLAVQTDGASILIWRALTDSNTVSFATAVAEGGAALSFGADIQPGDSGEKISGLQVYGEAGDIWVLKEGSLYQLKTADGTNWYPYKFKLEEINTVIDNRNGFAHLVHNVYMYFSLLDGLQRYYNNALDNVGPDVGSGLPSLRQGPVYAMAGYPGRYIAAINAGSAGYSSLMMNNGSGWHELYRSTTLGNNIRSCFVQSIPGDHVDRLWFDEEDDLLWIPISLNPYTHPAMTYNFYNYTPESYVITGWHYVNLRDVEKFWSAIKLASENLSSVCTVDIDYQVDNDATWYNVGTFDTSFTQELSFTSDSSLIGKRLRLRLRLRTTENDSTPRVLSTVIEAVTRVQHKYQNSLTFRVKDVDLQLDGILDAMSLDTKLTQLEAWASSALPITCYSVIRQFNDQKVLIEPTSLRVLHTIRDDNGNTEGHVCQLALIEI